MIRSLILASSLVAAGAFGDAVPVATDVVPRRDGPRRVIVEFAGQPAAYAARNASSIYATLARFRRDLDSIARTAALSKKAAAPPFRIRHEYALTFAGAAVEVSGGEIDAIRRLPYVRAIHMDRAVQALSATATADALLSDAGTRVNSLGLQTRGEGITVAVIDTGIDYNHPALGGGFGPGHRVAGGYDFINDDADPFDDNGHGTHVSGIIAADSDMLQGVAPRATLLGFKVLNNNGAGSSSDVMAGIEAAADPNGDGDFSDHANVANLSLGGLGSADDPQSRAVDAAMAAGVIMCVAAGNAGGFAIINSPGSARSAITVGAINDSGTMASFSSRGPTPGDLLFKPDVVAPGVNIISTFPGGGTASLSGTSMATPHVAGVCALLASLHPGWTPAEIKMALASTATSITGTPAERGAGRVDALLASQATILAGGSGLSFGLDAVSGPAFESSRSVVITNHGSGPRTLNASSATVPGVTLSITPASAVIQPGESMQFDVQILADNARVGYPTGKIVSGAVDFTGDGESLHVPWLIVRSARVTISYQVFGGVSFGYMPASKDPTVILPYSDEKAEAYVTPGKVWDFLISGRDPDVSEETSHIRLLLTTNHAINEDDTISLSAADAPYEIALAAMDDQGHRLSSLPRIADHRKYTVILHLVWEGKPNGTFDFIVGAIDSMHASALPNLRVMVHETYMDIDNARFFAVSHDEFRDLAGPVTLSRDISSYSRSRWIWSSRSADEKTLTACALILRRGDVDVSPFISICMARDLSTPVTIDSFISREIPSDMLRALSFSSETTELSYLRAVDDSTVVSTDSTPGPQAFRMENGGEATVGVGPVYPLSFLQGTSQSPPGGFAGPFGELRNLDGTAWATYDASGKQVATGFLPGSPLPAESPCAGCRIEISRDSLRVDGHSSRGNLELRLGQAGDRFPPVLTSLRLLDADGRVVDGLKGGESATLRFSAADNFVASTQLPNSAATKAAWRLEGTNDWHPLSVAIESSESGINKAFGRHLAGDSYRVDLSAATAVPNGLIDLRVELEDTAGNAMTWTQTPAFMVGDVPVPPRRRPAR